MGAPCSKQQQRSGTKSDIENLFVKTDLVRVFSKHSFCVLEESYNATFESLATNKGSLEKFYKLEAEPVATGYFGELRRAKARTNLSNTFAIKTIHKDKVEKEMNVLYAEMYCLKVLDHPNVVCFYESFQDETNFHIAMEYLAGGELTKAITDNLEFGEREVRTCFYQVLKVINHLHGKGICHRDIKPENFLFAKKNSFNEIKIVDFGLSKRCITEVGRTRMFRLCGSPYYVAPEVLTGDYDEKCDLWSAGIMLYFMLAKRLPYNVKNTDKTIFFKSVLREKFDYSSPFARFKISPEAIDLTKRLLERSPFKRVSISQALHHPWFQNIEIPKPMTLTNEIFISRLSKFKDVNSFKKVILTIISRFLSISELYDYKFMFNIIDKDGDGIITFPEIRYFVLKNSLSLSDDEISAILDSLPHKVRNHIYYSEFIAACLRESMYNSQDFLKGIYRYLNQSNAAYVHMESIQYFYDTLGYNFSSEAFDQLLVKYNITERKHPNGLSYKEFCLLMLAEGYTKEQTDAFKKTFESSRFTIDL